MNYTLNTETLAQQMRDAYAAYGEQVGVRVSLLAQERENNADNHRVFCIVKGILSPQMKLSHNIRLARFVAYAIQHTDIASGPELYHIAVSAGLRVGVATGSHIASIIEQRDIILAMADADMTFDNLLKLKGVGSKVAAWIMSLYFGDADVYTIDRHMLMGFFGENNKTPTAKQYREIMVAVMALHREVLGDIPALVGQWSLWNMYRDGQHDDHYGVISAEVV